MVECILLQLHLKMSATPFVLERLMGNVAQIGNLKRLQLKNAAAAQQGTVNREVWVFSSGANQDYRAVFHPRQQRILLGFVEAVNLVDEQDRALAVELVTFLRIFHGTSDVCDAGKYRVQGDEVRAGGVSNN